MDEIEQRINGRMFQVESSTNEALRVANEALTRVEIWEKANERQLQHIVVQLSDLRIEMKASLGKLFDRFWMAAVGVICMLLAVSAYLYVESAKINKEFMTQMINQTKNGSNL